MNYKKESLAKKKKHISSKKNLQKKRVGVRLFKAFIVCILITCIVAVGGAGFFVKKIIDNAPVVTPDKVLPSGEITFVYAEDGTVIEQLVTSGANRISVPISDIPLDLQHAFVAIEDERFYKHNGIDMQGIIRAGVVGLTSGGFSEGASTLTQQLIKNNVFINFTQEKTFYDRLERKLQEQYLAVAIEKQMSKNEVLEAYMNTINLGQNCLGVQAAAKRYFNKNVSELTLSESAVIAGITQNPTKFDPVINPENNADRRKKVLGDMLTQGYITQEQMDECLADNVYERIAATAAAADFKPYSYFVDELTRQVMRDLMDRKAYSDTQAFNALYGGGLSIMTTQNLGMQQIADEEVANDANYPGDIEWGLEYALTIYRGDGTIQNFSKEMVAEYVRNAWGREFSLVFYSPDEARQAVEEFKSTLGIGEGDRIDENIDFTPQPQVSVVIMEQSTGKVKAIVGGRGEKRTSLSLNRATDSTRQPGSCFKIVSTYGPAIDAHGYTLASTIVDEPFAYTNGKTVNNWDFKYIGPTRVRYAIEHSMNVCAVKTLTAIGLQSGFDYLKSFGFTTLVNYDDDNYPNMTDVGQATALGGITRGVYNLEMTAAYAAIANNGTYIKPIFYTQVLDRDGNVLLDNTVPDSHQVIKDSTAALLTSAMRDVINIGTGTPARLSAMPAAGKTGTTENSTDLWISAYTPYLTCSVWGGYDTNKPMSNMSQSWHMIIWRNIMERIHGGAEVRDFVMPASVEQKTVCTQTGLQAVTGCPAITEFFAIGSVPSQFCPGHAKREENPPPNTNPNDDKKDQNSNTPTPGGDTGSGGDTGGGDTGSGGDTGGGDTGSGGDTGGGDTGSGGDAGSETPPGGG